MPHLEANTVFGTLFERAFLFEFVQTGLVRNGAAKVVERLPHRAEVAGRKVGNGCKPQRLGIPKVALASLILCSLYFILFVWVDSAGTYGFLAGLFRVVLSVLVSTPVCVAVARLLRSQ